MAAQIMACRGTPRPRIATRGRVYGRNRGYGQWSVLWADDTQGPYTVEHSPCPVVAKPESSCLSAQRGLGYDGTGGPVEKEDVEIAGLAGFVEAIGYDNEPYPIACNGQPGYVCGE